jgi:hypothetical protein
MSFSTPKMRSSSRSFEATFHPRFAVLVLTVGERNIFVILIEVKIDVLGKVTYFELNNNKKGICTRFFFDPFFHKIQ